jgi:hypothetical protein
MATMCPVLSEARLDRLQSRAEAKFYRACRDQLAERYLVLHSVPWIDQPSGQPPRDGETDFTIFDPQAGLLVVEVKGGGVTCDPQAAKWTSVDATGRSHQINDPFLQAMREKKAALQQIRRHPLWPSLSIQRFAAGHSVFFPDVEKLEPLVMSHAPLEIMGGGRDMTRMQEWVSGLFAYWTGQLSGSQPLGPKGMRLVEEIFCTAREVRPLVSAQLAEEEVVRITLTERQSYVLRTLSRKKRAAICGGAGTGKTLLAVQKASELADAGFETLLLCYNRPLADHLSAVLGQHARLACMTFHQLCLWRIEEAFRRSSRLLEDEARLDYPGADRFDVQWPHALCLSVDVLPERFDAIVVDEGQDFREEFWLPVEMLLRDTTQSMFYIFYDQNQAIYRRVSTFPVRDDPYILSANCRNTLHIHHAAYRFFRGDPTDPPSIEGVPLDSVAAPSAQPQANRIHAMVTRLIAQEGVAPHDIVVLVVGQPKGFYYGLLEPTVLPHGACFAREIPNLPRRVLMDTVSRFKGLESPIVILWGIDEVDPRRDRELLYVGLSRAKSRLYLVGTESSCERVLSAENLTLR